MDEHRDPDALVTGANQALADGRWVEARSLFESAVAAAESAEALEGLGFACSWLEDGPATFQARRGAYRLYRAAGDRRSAARVACDLARDHYFVGEHAVTDGWIRRAHRLLEGLPPTPELGWLRILESDVAYFVGHDSVGAERHATEAARLGGSLADPNLEMLALAYQGLASVSQGRIRDGMQLLDEATVAAVSGEMGIEAATTTCCCLIYACEHVRDYDRAVQWCRRVEELCERWPYPMMFSLCRTHYAGVLLWRGDWGQADAELVTAVQSLTVSRPAVAAEGLVKLASLRYRQGRLAEAEAFLTRAEAPPFRVLAAELAMLVRAQIALDRDDPRTAEECAERFLRAVADKGRMERPAALELLVRARIALGDRSGAKQAVDELAAIAADVPTDPMVGAALLARGLVAAADGEHAIARGFLEDAIACYERSGAPFEVARTRLELTNSLRAVGRAPLAVVEARSAWQAFRSLGAAGEAVRAATVLREMTGADHVPAAADPVGLTRREADVVKLVAHGLSNQEIAAQLVLSIRTVERHLSNVYDKFGTGGKVGRAVVAMYAREQHLG